jgi:hypothetical protein
MKTGGMAFAFHPGRRSTGGWGRRSRLSEVGRPRVADGSWPLPKLLGVYLTENSKLAGLNSSVTTRQQFKSTQEKSQEKPDNGLHEDINPD